jgi:glycerol-3-phosphate O-acyltransferase
MLEGGDNVILFPEGGRSYTGAMLPMKAGLIAANLIAQSRSPNKAHFYLPFTVSYEALPEMPHLQLLEKSRRWRKAYRSGMRGAAGTMLYYGADLAAMARFVLSARSAGRYGNVYLDYGSPFEIRSVVDVPASCSSRGSTRLGLHKASARRLADHIAHCLARLYRILPLHVLAYLLSNGHSRHADMIATIPAVLAALHAGGRNCRSLDPLSAREVFDQGVAQLRHLNAVTMRAGDVTVVTPEIVTYCARTIATPGLEV